MKIPCLFCFTKIICYTKSIQTIYIEQRFVGNADNYWILGKGVYVVFVWPKCGGMGIWDFFSPFLKQNLGFICSKKGSFSMTVPGPLLTEQGTGLLPL